MTRTGKFHVHSLTCQLLFKTSHSFLPPWVKPSSLSSVVTHIEQSWLQFPSPRTHGKWHTSVPFTKQTFNWHDITNDRVDWRKKRQKSLNIIPTLPNYTFEHTFISFSTFPSQSNPIIADEQEFGYKQLHHSSLPARDIRSRSPGPLSLLAHSTRTPFRRRAPFGALCRAADQTGRRGASVTRLVYNAAGTSKTRSRAPVVSGGRWSAASNTRGTMFVLPRSILWVQENNFAFLAAFPSRRGEASLCRARRAQEVPSSRAMTTPACESAARGRTGREQNSEVRTLRQLPETVARRKGCAAVHKLACGRNAVLKIGAADGRRSIPGRWSVASRCRGLLRALF